MLIAAQAVYDCRLENGEEQVGSVRDLLVNDATWAVRYLLVDAGSWLAGRRVLLSPAVVEQRDWSNRRLWTGLTREQVRNGPPVEADAPVSRQKEIELAEYYGWAAYWATGEPESADANADPRLRSAKEVTGYHIEAVDGSIGHVEDVLVDEEGLQAGAWHIRYWIVDTRNWLPGGKVVVSPDWTDSIDWSESSVRVDLTREQIEGSPPFLPEAPVNRRDEEVLYDYYGKPKYWLGHTRAIHR